MKLELMGIIFGPMILGILIYIANKKIINKLVFVLQFIILINISYITYHTMIQNDIFRWVIGSWSSMIGIELKVSSTSLLFIIMTHISIWYVLFYSWDEQKTNIQFLFFLEFMQSSLYMLFLVNDLFSMFIAFELITIISSILIFLKNDPQSLKAGLYYLLYNSVGMTFYLLGLILIYVKMGTLNIDHLTMKISTLPINYGLAFCYGFFLIAFSLKAALFPLSSWLPIAHSSAYTPISALMSGLLIKVGIYGFIKINMMMPEYTMSKLIIIIAMISSLFGVIEGLLQTDMKRILAFSTISQIGVIMIALMGTENINLAASFHLFNHFLAKSLLFLVIGIIIKLTKERDIRKIKSLYKFSPILAIALIIGIFSITGAPFSGGALSKLLIKSNFYNLPIKNYFYLINFGTFLLFFRFLRILIGNTIKRAKLPKCQIFIISLLTIMILLTYPLELNLLNFLDIQTYSLSFKNILKEFLIYIIYIILSFVFYRKFKKPNSQLSRKLAQKRLSFPAASGALIAYLAVVMINIYIQNLYS